MENFLLLDGIFDLLDGGCHGRVTLDLAADFGAGTDDRGMIPPAEFFADLDVGQIEQMPAQVDGDVAGIGDVLCSCLGCNLLVGQAIIVSHSLDDLLW